MQRERERSVYVFISSYEPKPLEPNKFGKFGSVRFNFLKNENSFNREAKNVTRSWVVGDRWKAYRRVFWIEYNAAKMICSIVTVSPLDGWTHNNFS